MEIKKKLSHVLEVFTLEISRCINYRSSNSWAYEVGTYKKILAKNQIIVSDYETVLRESIEKIENILEQNIEGKDLGQSTAKLEIFDDFLFNCTSIDWTEKNEEIENKEDFLKHIQIEIEIRKNYIREIEKVIKYIESKLITVKKKFSIRGQEGEMDSLTLKLLFGEI